MNLSAGLLLLLVGVPAEPAQAQDVAITGTPGFGGRCVRGERAPVLVEIDNRGADREIVLCLTWASNGLRQRESVSLDSLGDRRGPLHRIPLTLPAGSRKVVAATLVAPDGEGYSVWAFALTPGGKTLAGAELGARLVPRPAKLLAIVGADRPEGLDVPLVETARIRPADLPEDSRGYAGLEALLWLDGRVSDIRVPAQLDALRAWVSSGGHLIVARANPVGLEKTPVADWLPVSLQGAREVERLTSLGTLPGTPAAPMGKAALVGARLLRGKTILEQDGLPIVADARFDGGRVTFVAFDPCRAPFAGWDGARTFWQQLLPRCGAATEQPEDDLPPPRLVGSSSLARTAASFPDVEAPAIGGLLILIGLYVLAVGPGDYLILRWLRRLELTWFTFPTCVFAFTALILIVGGAFVRRASLQREIAIVDHYEGSGFCRRVAFGAVLAPSDMSYAFAEATPVSSGFLARRISSDYSEGLTDVTMSRAPEQGRNWIISRGATGLLIADRCSTEKSPIDFRIVGEAAESLEVEFQNDSGSDLEDALLATRHGLFKIPRIARGKSRVPVPRAAPNAAAFASSEGTFPRREDRAAPRYYGEDYQSARSVPRATLDQEARKLLLGLSFAPPHPPSDAETLAGLARTLDASPWIEAGGSVLVVFRPSTEMLIEVKPYPNRRTAYVMTRVFKGPLP